MSHDKTFFEELAEKQEFLQNCVANANIELIGYDQLMLDLLSKFNAKKLHHAVMLHGVKSCGKATFFYNLIKKILFANKVKNENNVNLFLQNCHPDVMILSAKENDTIDVEQARAIGDFVNITPSIMPFKIVLIDAIDNFNTSSANSILKCLEEPNKNVYFFIVCHNKNSIMQTIISRCLIINLPNQSFGNSLKVLSCFADFDNAIQMLKICNNNIFLTLKMGLIDGEMIYKKILNDITENRTDSIKIVSDFIKNKFDITDLIVQFFNRIYDRMFCLTSEVISDEIEYETGAIKVFLNKKLFSTLDIAKKYNTFITLVKDSEVFYLDKVHLINTLLANLKD